jgi:hypothetical protein
MAAIMFIQSKMFGFDVDEFLDDESAHETEFKIDEVEFIVEEQCPIFKELNEKIGKGTEMKKKTEFIGQNDISEERKTEFSKVNRTLMETNPIYVQLKTMFDHGKVLNAAEPNFYEKRDDMLCANEKIVLQHGKNDIPAVLYENVETDSYSYGRMMYPNNKYYDFDTVAFSKLCCVHLEFPMRLLAKKFSFEVKRNFKVLVSPENYSMIEGIIVDVKLENILLFHGFERLCSLFVYFK